MAVEYRFSKKSDQKIIFEPSQCVLLGFGFDFAFSLARPIAEINFFEISMDKICAEIYVHSESFLPHQ